MSGADDHIYLCIDLKSFYASVECVERGLDPFTTNLVVADPDRTDTTICLAITPAMKELGIPNRCRVYDIPKGIEYIMAKPQMRHYMEVSARIYSVYLRYIAPEDIHVYSIDECFIDCTPYLGLYAATAREMAVMLMDAVFQETGICATAGIGTNLFLAKIALDITAKHVPDHIGYLDEEIFRATIWHHQPITDIWNIGPGIATRLAKYGVYDLFGVTQMEEKILYREFGINAELLIDHAWGIEPCTMAEIHAFKPSSSSITNGQLLPCDYSFDEGLVILREMVDSSVLELLEKHLVTDHISLYVAYDRRRRPGSSGTEGGGAETGLKKLGTAGGGDDPDEPQPSEPHPFEPQPFQGEHGVRHRYRDPADRASTSHKLPERTNSFKKLSSYAEQLFRQCVDPTRVIRRISISFGGLIDEDFATVDLFSDLEAEEKERDLQKALLDVKGRFGKNAVMRGTSYRDKATGLERNELVGGHHG